MAYGVPGWKHHGCRSKNCGSSRVVRYILLASQNLINSYIYKQDPSFLNRLARLLQMWYRSGGFSRKIGGGATMLNLLSTLEVADNWL